VKKSVRIAFIATIAALAISWVALRQQNASLEERVASSAKSSSTGEP
jgi:hypothetical protein